MRDALNQFVIRGVASNIAFQAALMQNPRFLSGDFNTGLIAEQYPKGFNAADVPHDDPAMLVAVAAAIHRQYLARNATISGQMPGHEFVPGDDFVVLLGNDPYHARVLKAEGGWDVECAGERYELRSIWQFGDPLYVATLNGQPICMQIERRGLVYRLFHWGVQADMQVMSARTAELKARMPVKAAPDMSKFLLSPMPGLLTQVAVAVGQEVKAGEILAKIEAMKMENVLKAERDCVVEKLLANPGESLAVDQAIIAFK
jgi:propionyl-CoA carboxylase alpha chain